MTYVMIKRDKDEGLFASSYKPLCLKFSSVPHFIHKLNYAQFLLKAGMSNLEIKHALAQPFTLHLPGLY
jgi:hypothetical protein